MLNVSRNSQWNPFVKKGSAGSSGKGGGSLGVLLSGTDCVTLS